MKRNKTIYFTVMIALIFCSSIYGSETVAADINQENVTDEEMGWPHKFKMHYQFGHFSGYKFFLNNQEYSFIEIKKIFDITDIVTKRLFDEAYQRYKNPSRNGQLDFIELVKKAIAGFNAFIAAGSPETAQLKEYLKKLYIEKKKSEMQVQREEIPYFTADRPLYLGFIGTTSLLVSNGYATQLITINPSIRIGYFFKENWKKHNLGFFIDLGYMYCFSDEFKNFPVEHYLTFSPQFVYKTYAVNSRKSIQFLFGIGPYFALRIAGSNQHTFNPGTDYFSEYNFNRIMIGVNVNFGLFAIFPKSKYAITLITSARFASRQSQINSGRFVSDDIKSDYAKKVFFYIGFELGILFKIN